MTSSLALPTLTIDLQAVRDNYRLLQRRAGKAKCAAVLKANAYGLGADAIAPALVQEGCRHFFVAHIDEGVRLRKVVPRDAEIYVLHGVPSIQSLEFVQHQLIPVLNSLEQIKTWRIISDKLDVRLPAAIQFDSGMSRMGLSTGEVRYLKRNEHLLNSFNVALVMTHLACAEQQQHAMNEQQLESFRASRALFPRVSASIANSSGIFLGEDYQFDLVRPGAALYGIAPLEGEENPLKQAVFLAAPIIQTRKIANGGYVGYGVRHQADREQVIATLGIGYADGWPRAAERRTHAFLGGRAAPLVGAISMDSVTVDVSSIEGPQLKPGDTMDLICRYQTVDDLARATGTIGYEILTRLGNRLQRIYLDKSLESKK